MSFWHKYILKINNVEEIQQNLSAALQITTDENIGIQNLLYSLEQKLTRIASYSKEYQELLTKVGEYRKVQIQTDLAVDGAATTMTQKLGSALNGATSGFAATQGAMALFGDENQEDSWRHLALEVVVTLSETAPAMVRKVAGGQLANAIQVRIKVI